MVGHALLGAASSLYSTPLRQVEASVGMSADAAGKSACATSRATERRGEDRPGGLSYWRLDAAAWVQRELCQGSGRRPGCARMHKAEPYATSAYQHRLTTSARAAVKMGEPFKLSGRVNATPRAAA